MHHAVRQARYRGRRENVTHQTSPPSSPSGMVLLPPPITPSGEQEVDHAASPTASRVGDPRCARCGRRGRFVRHVTLAHVRKPRPTPWR
jgi:hypothetical protein